MENVTVLSSLEEPSRITAGSMVTSTLIQEGVSVDRGAVVSNSLLMEHSHVDCNAQVCMCCLSCVSIISVLILYFEPLSTATLKGVCTCAHVCVLCLVSCVCV